MRRRRDAHLRPLHSGTHLQNIQRLSGGQPGGWTPGRRCGRAQGKAGGLSVPRSLQTDGTGGGTHRHRHGQLLGERRGGPGRCHRTPYPLPRPQRQTQNPTQLHGSPNLPPRPSHDLLRPLRPPHDSHRQTLPLPRRPRLLLSRPGLLRHRTRWRSGKGPRRKLLPGRRRGRRRRHRGRTRISHLRRGRGPRGTAGVRRGRGRVLGAHGRAGRGGGQDGHGDRTGRRRGGDFRAAEVSGGGARAGGQAGRGAAQPR
mmetsp:Transcript_42745/g.100364  ORF Transcript_42745/g.100364 Transcript_42745/m.100364 type:complete len:256 (-) Transcript_42745:1231-1998(-)